VNSSCRVCYFEETWAGGRLVDRCLRSRHEKCSSGGSGALFGDVVNYLETMWGRKLDDVRRIPHQHVSARDDLTTSPRQLKQRFVNFIFLILHSTIKSKYCLISTKHYQVITGITDILPVCADAYQQTSECAVVRNFKSPPMRFSESCPGRPIWKASIDFINEKLRHCLGVYQRGRT
jgi:hypothetical protein